jgi:hypothetical protein
VSLVLQVPGHLLHTEKLDFKELIVDLHHEVEVHDRLAHQFLVE